MVYFRLFVLGLVVSQASYATSIWEKIGLAKSFQEKYKSLELKTIGSIGSADGAPLGHGTIAMVQGKLAIITAPDSGRRGGGFSFLDLDLTQPAKPQVKLIHRENNEAIREPHGFGFHVTPTNTYVALQTIRGLQIWDWTDLTKPVLVTDMTLLGIEESDYNLGAWWVFWQAPYIYVGGSGNGLYVIDARDIKNPQLKTRVAPENFRLERVGSVFAVGNLLAASVTHGSGLATIDISDPIRPRLIDSMRGVSVYAAMFNGGKFMVAGEDDKFHSVAVGADGRMKYETSLSIGDKGGYLSTQDGFAFVGASKQFAKIDNRKAGDPKVVAWGSSHIASRDEDFANVLGPYVLISDDHGNGSYWVQHAPADKNPPVVNMVSPSARAENQAVTSRVGLTFTDQIKIESVNAKTFIVRPVGGEALKGFYSTQTNIVNFTPETALKPNQEYEVEVAGIQDYWGNIATPFKSTFKTGAGESVPDLQIAADASAVLVGREVQLSVTGGERGAQYSWNFGDGTGVRTESAKFSKAFAKPGHYSVSVTVEGKSVVTSNAFTVTVHAPLTALKPSHASSIARTRGRVFVVNPDQGSVSATDGTTLLWETATGKDPKTLSVDGQERVWVANERGDTVSVLDGATGAIVKQIALPFGSMPFGIAVAPTGERVYVTLAARGEVAILSVQELKVLGAKAVGPQPRGIAIAADGSYALVSRFISPDERGEVYRVDLKGEAKTSAIPLALDESADTEASGRGVPNYLGFLAISPDGLNAWVPSKKDNIQRGAVRDGKPLTFENTVRAIVSQIDLTSGRESLELRRDFNDRDMPVAVAYSPLGDYIFVAVQGSNTVEILDAYTGKAITGLEHVGLAPQGLVLSEDGKTLYVHSFLSRQVIVYDVSRLDSLVKIKEVTTIRRETMTEDVLLGKQTFYNSKDRRMARDGYISCASCHQDGGEDGRVWDFTDRGEGLRNTITLRGRAGMKQGRVHWSGNFDEIQDFENDIRNAFGGTGFLTDEQFAATKDTMGAKKAGLSRELDALAAYVTSLNEPEKIPHREDADRWSEAAVQGQKIFARLQCASCHSGAEFTDSAEGKVHDVGTIGEFSGKRLNEPLVGFDTPSLRGVWATAPYLHDGSAKTIRDVFTKKNRRGQHGQTQSLSQSELQQLLTYILSL